MSHGPTARKTRVTTFLALALAVTASLLVSTPALAPPVEPGKLYVDTPRSQTAKERQRAKEIADVRRAQQEQAIVDAQVSRGRDAEEARRIRENKAVSSFPDFNGKDSTYSLFDGLRDAETREALRRHLRLDPIATEIGIESWRFTARPQLQDIADILQLARSRLPGKVELGMLLDPQVFGSGYSSIVDAWGGRPITQTPTNSLLSDYLASFKGNTLVLVGHVENNDYVYESPDGTKIRLNIEQLLIDGHKNGVLIVPIGCATADAGVGLGFVGEIGTDTVAAFLAELPIESPTIADVMQGMLGIGEIRVNIRDAANLFQFQVYPQGVSRPVTRVRIPYAETGVAGAPPANGSVLNATVAPYQLLPQVVAAEADQARPIWRTNWFVALLTNLWSYVAAWALLLLSSWLGSSLTQRWAFEHRNRQWVHQAFRLPLIACGWIGVPLVLIGVPVLIVIGWSNGIINFTTVVVILIIGRLVQFASDTRRKKVGQ